ncbi:oleosin 16 kDa [Selaginella moellendorffii]|uniref:oleosin 16 kDa n=1 Tax=Selaginella moellendorffii TaxID=88036 RepID=UPI000D1C7EF2|nr:oleosin 16 kDa [Selaginella moellendorffii]|eukprot:XP_002971390.2 oleosin 16 kDa [Selaginella moellendorffii]
MAERATDRAREHAGRAQEQARGMMQKIQERSPNSKQVLGLLTIITGVVVALVIGGVTLGGTVLTLLLASPVFLLLSPVLVPIGIVIALATGGFLSASAVFVGFCSVVSWLYNYARGRHPVGADQIDAAKHRIADTASHVTEKAREVTGYLQSRVPEAAPGA